MIGPFIAILSAGFFGLSKIFLRRAVLRVSDAGLGTLISVPMSVPLFFLILIFSGRTGDLFKFSWAGYIWLSLAGILHYVVGRTLNYNCVQLAGANITNLICKTNVLVAVVIGITLLREPVSVSLVLGVLFISAGISLPGLSHLLQRNSPRRFLEIPARAYLLGFGCGAAWGVSPILIKVGLGASGAPVAGATISFFAASIALCFSLLNAKRRAATTHLSREAVGLFMAAGFLSFGANLGRYIALSVTPASVVEPLFSTSPVFLLFFSFIFNRKLELFSKPIVVGTLLMIVGSILLI